MCLRKFGKEVLLLFFRNANACVSYSYQNTRIGKRFWQMLIVTVLCRDMYCAAFRSKFETVGDKIIEYLRDTAAITIGFWQIGFYFTIKRYLFFLGIGSK